ncbi:MAG: polymerase subunit gamma/tau [Candidatus Saccharibacteria bacterium]|nr:polymerase subunit gamma/tau [Candidatus Saccharibacteria bacterium]
MGQALYRKYRSKSLSEIIGQEHITTALQTAIKSGRISHAYLFTGPRGTGKTSIARILANEINGLPYSTDPHLDIIEIDAASNRRIDEIRDLRDKVYIAPTSAKYKVYIIDEVHMLTREAFNALLKTLEEPPAHVVFILATTDAHKLPETIISRTQRYNFRPVEAAKVAAHLGMIAKKEKYTIDNDALNMLAEHGEGSFRDSISMLDQVSHHSGKITADVVRAQLGIPSEEGVQAVLASLAKKDVSAPVTALQALYDQGYRATAIAEQMSQQLRKHLTSGDASLPAVTVLALLKSLLDVASSHNPERYLELVLMQALTPAETQLSGVRSFVEEPTKTPATSAPKPKQEPAPSTSPVTVEEQPAEAPPETPSKAKPKASGKQVPLDEEAWSQVLAELKKQYNTIYGIVRMAHTDFSEPGRVSLSFVFAFHQKRITDPKNRKIVTDTIEQVTGQQIELVCSLSKEPQPRAVSAKKPDEALQDVSSIFGGGELL